VKILIVTPARAGSRGGNRVTALRWARRLRELGHTVRLDEGLRAGAWDLLIALHARKSFGALRDFQARHPGVPTVVALTGTDLYQELAGSREAQEAVERATRLIVLQPLAIAALPEPVRWKARAIFQSTPELPRLPPASDAFEVCVIGHLRDVKDPLRAAAAARLLPAGSKIRILHAGEALSPELAARARAEMAENPRYRWLGPLSRVDALALLRRSRLLCLTSRLEGGANVVTEAIAASVPVLSTRIDGSLGLLGHDHPGYFPVGDTRALATLLERAEAEPAFLAALQASGARLRPELDPSHERAAFSALLAELSGELAHDVEQGLGRNPKRLACRYFYDPAGSKLFEEICALPEYYLTRAERQIFADHAREMVAQLPPGVALVELGSGSAEKTRLLLDALFARQPRVRYLPIDISPAALADSTRALTVEYPALAVTPIAAEYEAGLRALAARLPDGAPRLVLWLGSNIGNLDRDEAARFLGRVRAGLGPHDRMLLGVDLRKSRAVLEPAYDDAAGVTARFNLNLLERINRELGGDFELDAFAHRAAYDEVAGRIDMYLVSRRAQTVHIRALGRAFSFADGEAIHTESSYKYAPAELDAVARAAGFTIAARWLDREERFCECLLRP
jgi:dimethylhistidine N-methyltransferase